MKKDEVVKSREQELKKTKAVTGPGETSVVKEDQSSKGKNGSKNPSKES